MKTGEDFILQSIPIPRVTASRTHAKIATWTSGSFFSRSDKSADHQSEQSAKYEETRRSHLEDTRRKDLEENHRAKYKETWRGNVDYRIQGARRSTVQKECCNRKEIVKKIDSTVRE